jgi:hypothetical protein
LVGQRCPRFFAPDRKPYVMADYAEWLSRETFRSTADRTTDGYANPAATMRQSCFPAWQGCLNQTVLSAILREANPTQSHASPIFVAASAFRNKLCRLPADTCWE